MNDTGLRQIKDTGVEIGEGYMKDTGVETGEGQ